MSLLLDAMKKSGDKSHSTGLSNLSLEEHPGDKQRTSATESSASSARATGENMFAAKKTQAAPRWRWKLGLIPTTLLVCSVLGAFYGYYVWLEISPPAQVVVQRPATPPPLPISTPAPLPLVASLAPAHAPAMTPPKVETAATVIAPKATKKLTANPKAYVPKSFPGMTIEHKQETDSITPALLDAYQAYQRSDYVTASLGYRNVLSKDAHNRDALLGLGAIAQQQNQDETAQYYYRQVLLLDPRDAVARAAMSAYSTNAGADNESQLKQMLSEQPRSGALHYALGNVYAEQSRWGDAQQAYFNARTLEPTNAQFNYNLAVSLDHLGQSKIAAQYYQQALQLDANNNSGFDHAQAQQRLNELNAPSR